MRIRVQQALLEMAVCRGASVELEDPVIKQQENANVGTDSLGHCKCTEMNSTVLLRPGSHGEGKQH